MQELVFVKRIDLHGAIEEDVYEAAHLEILPPSAKTSIGDMSAQDKDGLTIVTCMNTQNEMLLYNEKKHWNPALRKQFFASVKHPIKPAFEPLGQELLRLQPERGCRETLEMGRGARRVAQPEGASQVTTLNNANYNHAKLA